MRRRFRLAVSLTTFLLIVLAFIASTSTAADSTRLRIGIVKDSIYKITPDDLSAAGVDPTSVDPRSFAMSSLGQPVAILVEGEEDGRFDAEDAILFFGEKFRGTEMEEKYTDERVYWLDIGDEPGPRITEVDATPQGDLTPPTDFASTVRAEESNYWYTQHTLNPPTKDTWFWDELRPTSSTEVVRDYAQSVPHPVTDAPATLWIEQNARAENEHVSIISMNSIELEDVTWSGKTRSYISTTVPSGTLTQGVNKVSVRSITADGVRKDWVYFNYWELRYRRLFKAWDGQIDFVVEDSGPHSYDIGGWQTNALMVLDISDPFAPRQLTGMTESVDDGGIAVQFRADDQPDDRYWLQSDSAISSPDSLRLRPPTGLRYPSNGADVVIVTSSELRPAAEQLAAWHESKGRRAVVADFQDVVDEFNHGIYNPHAVTLMMSWSQTEWSGLPPKYLTLVGDGHWNFKGFNPDLYPPQPNHIPPYLKWVDPAQGEVPSDAAYGDLDGDRKPDLAVGRLSVNTLQQAETVVAKIVNYEDTMRGKPWQRRALFVADNPDSSGNFPAVSDAIIEGYLPSDLIPERIYLGETVPDAEAATQAIVDGINRGALMVQYTGHGAPGRWTHELIWTLEDIASLDNQSQLPIIMTFNCLDGYFAHPDPENFAIAEEMQRYSGGGSIAAISPSGLGSTYDQQRFREFLMEAMFEDGVRELGEALLQAQQTYYDYKGGPSYLTDTMMLYGDPALRIPEAAIQHYLPNILK